MSEHPPLPDRQRPSALQHYSGAYFSQVDHFIEATRASPPARGHRHYRVNPCIGQGWTDLHEFENGLMLGRMCYRLSQPTRDDYHDFPDNISIGFMVSGEVMTIRYPQPGLSGSAGNVFVRNADPGMLQRCAPAGQLLRGISIDLPRHMLDTMAGQGLDLSGLGRRDSYTMLQASPQMAATLRHIGQRMLDLDVEDSLLARLELEALTLDVLLKLINAFAGSAAADARLGSRWQSELDRALDILHAQWQSTHTIAQLARHVGINECYLKVLFRQRTGMTIAAYQRQLRMQHGLDLLKSGRHSIGDVAALCGYAHAGKFAQAFRRVHGVTPSSFRPSSLRAARAE